MSPNTKGGGLFISSLFEGGGLFERGGLFNLETTMVSVLQKRLEYKVEKLKSGAHQIWWAPAQVQEVLGRAAEDKNQIRSSRW